MSRSMQLTAALTVMAICVAAAAYRTSTKGMLPARTPQADTAWIRAVVRPVGGGTLPNHIVDLHIGSGGTGVAATSPRRIWQTVDGGRSWTPFPDTSIWGVGVAFRDNIGVIVRSSGLIQRTTDAGGSWSNLESGVPLVRVAFSAGSIVAVGPGGVLHSDDDGATWARTAVPRAAYYDVAIRNRTGIVVGGGGRILRSVDEGRTWSDHRLDRRATFRGVAFVDDTIAVIVGSGGLILRSIDTGQHWSEVRSPTLMHLQGVAFSHARAGVAVGFYGTVLRSSDGGHSWDIEESGTQAHLLVARTASDSGPVLGGWFQVLLLSSKHVTSERSLR